MNNSDTVKRGLKWTGSLVRNASKITTLMNNIPWDQIKELSGKLTGNKSITSPYNLQIRF